MNAQTCRTACASVPFVRGTPVTSRGTTTPSMCKTMRSPPRCAGGPRAEDSVGAPAVTRRQAEALLLALFGAGLVPGDAAAVGYVQLVAHRVFERGFGANAALRSLSRWSPCCRRLPLTFSPYPCPYAVSRRSSRSARSPSRTTASSVSLHLNPLFH